MKTLGERLRAVRKELGLTQTQLRDKSGLKSTSTISELESGETVHSPQLPDIADALGVNAYWLKTGKGQKTTNQRIENHDGRADEIIITQFDTGGRMGNGGMVLHDQPGVINSWRVSREWASKNIRNCTSLENLAIVTGFGDSMRPLFNPGDPLLVDTGVKSMDTDAVYFFRIGGDGFIKRVQRIPGPDGTVFRVKSANPEYETWEIKPGMDVEVFGRVLKIWRGEDM